LEWIRHSQVNHSVFDLLLWVLCVFLISSNLVFQATSSLCLLLSSILNNSFLSNKKLSNFSFFVRRLIKNLLLPLSSQHSIHFQRFFHRKLSNWKVILKYKLILLLLLE
jgi:hypothetical protein